MQISIAICTRERPELLARALASLARLIRPEDADLSLILVENGPARGAQEVLAAARLPFPAHYAHVPDIGLVPVRDRALAMADEIGADWLCFMDDDETAEPDWITAFRAAIAAYPDTPIFGGPCLYLPIGSFSDWYVPQAAYPALSGHVVRDAGTNNVCIHRSIFAADQEAQRFDPDYSLSGAEDSEFFHRQTRRGHKIRWIPEAVVLERIKPERASVRYRMARMRRNQVNAVRIRMKHQPAIRAHAINLHRIYRAAVFTLIYGVAGAAAYPVNPSWGRQTMALALLDIARLQGIVAAYRGEIPTPYAEVDGS